MRIVGIFEVYSFDELSKKSKARVIRRFKKSLIKTGLINHRCSLVESFIAEFSKFHMLEYRKDGTLF